MFALLNSGCAKCLAAYKDIQQGAIVPPVNELWAQVEEWGAENGWADYVEPEHNATTYEKEMAALNAQYDSDMLELAKAYNIAVARDGIVEQGKVAAVRQEIMN